MHVVWLTGFLNHQKYWFPGFGFDSGPNQNRPLFGVIHFLVKFGIGGDLRQKTGRNVQKV